MDFSDILQLTVAYGVLASTVFAIAYGAGALWRFFRALSDPGFKND